MKKINPDNLKSTFLENYLIESLDVAKAQYNYSEKIIDITGKIISHLNNDSTIFICGNGGSASDSQHFAAELVGRFENNRQPLPALALTTDSSVVTSVANDFGFEYIFSKQLEALAKNNDILIALSTSGKSENILNALKTGKQLGMLTITLTGTNTEEVKNNSDDIISIPSTRAGIIQQAHITVLQVIAGLIETCID
jgi:D-sedoheptulose 7-phosphate isomerase